MLEGVKEIGIVSLNKKGLTIDNPLPILIENPVNENYQQIVEICFETKDNNLVFTGIRIAPADSKNYLIYLYKRKGSAGANYTPVSLSGGKGLKATFENRIKSWAKNNIKDQGLIRLLSQALLKYEEQIKTEIEEKERSQGLESIILTPKIDNLYLGQIDEFKDYFLKAYYEKKSNISHRDGYCSICGKRGFVMGDEKPWTFYSLDKPGFIASGFRKDQGWKNYPVCSTCSLLIEEGKKHIEENLSFRFAGIPYYLIPKSVLSKTDNLEEALDIIEFNKKKEVKLRDLKHLADNEDYILDIASEQNDLINFNLLFFRLNKQQFSILLYLQDVLPSSIRQLFTVKQEVETPWIFKHAYKEKQELKNVEFTFRRLKEFTESIKSFLNLVEKIFKRRKIDYYFLLSNIMRKLRQAFANNYFIKPSILHAWQILMFLQRLNILYNYEGGKMITSENLIQNEVRIRAENFFNSFSQTFNSPEKRATFLTGVLVQFLLNIQSQRQGSEPFRKRLKGLKMKKADLIKIFPEAQNKLEEYDANYYKQLEQIIAEYFVQAGSDWQLKDDELNFYFLLGMNLADSKNKEGEFIFKASSEKI